MKPGVPGKSDLIVTSADGTKKLGFNYDNIVTALKKLGQKIGLTEDENGVMAKINAL